MADKQNNDRIVYPDEVEIEKNKKPGKVENIEGNSLEEPTEVQKVTVTSRNMIQVPGNCPPGFQMGSDGKCREVFN